MTSNWSCTQHAKSRPARSADSYLCAFTSGMCVATLCCESAGLDSPGTCPTTDDVDDTSASGRKNRGPRDEEASSRTTPHRSRTAEWCVSEQSEAEAIRRIVRFTVLMGDRFEVVHGLGVALSSHVPSRGPDPLIQRRVIVRRAHEGIPYTLECTSVSSSATTRRFTVSARSASRCVQQRCNAHRRSSISHAWAVACASYSGSPPSCDA